MQLGRATFPDACPAFLSDDDVQAFMDATFTPEQVASWVNSDDAALIVLFVDFMRFYLWKTLQGENRFLEGGPVL